MNIFNAIVTIINLIANIVKALFYLLSLLYLMRSYPENGFKKNKIIHLFSVEKRTFYLLIRKYSKYLLPSASFILGIQNVFSIELHGKC